MGDSYEITGELDILDEFIVEAEDYVSEVEKILLNNQTNKFTTEELDAIFRAVHSIKGCAGYFNLHDIGESSHKAESIMDKARRGQIVFGGGLKAIMLNFVDLERTLLDPLRV